MDTETALKLIETIRSVRLQIKAIERDLDAMERAVAAEVADDE
jgi:hypothetical protein